MLLNQEIKFGENYITYLDYINKHDPKKYGRIIWNMINQYYPNIQYTRPERDIVSSKVNTSRYSGKIDNSYIDGNIVLQGNFNIMNSVIINSSKNKSFVIAKGTSRVSTPCIYSSYIDISDRNVIELHTDTSRPTSIYMSKIINSNLKILVTMWDLFLDREDLIVEKYREGNLPETMINNPYYHSFVLKMYKTFPDIFPSNVPCNDCTMMNTISFFRKCFIEFLKNEVIHHDGNLCLVDLFLEYMDTYNRNTLPEYKL